MTLNASASNQQSTMALNFEGVECPAFDPANGIEVLDGGVFFSISEGSVLLMIKAGEKAKLVAALTEDQLHYLCSQIAQHLIQDGTMSYSTPTVLQ